MKALIPNLITIVNLLCGTTAILCSFGGYMEYVPYLVLGGFVADFFDGFVARALGVSSEMGKELDSLADMVSFGVLPGIIMYHMLNFACYESWNLPFNLYHLGAALSIAGFSAMRLAKFNVDTRESDSFFGIPTPTTAAFVTAILMVALYSDGRYNEYLFKPAVLWSFTALASVMMVIDFPMISNKVKGLSWAENKWKYGLLASMVPLLFFFDYYGLVLYYFAYIAFSIFQKVSK